MICQDVWGLLLNVAEALTQMDLERRGRETCGVVEVGIGETLPAVAHGTGILDRRGREDDLVSFNLEGGGIEQTVATGNLKSARAG